MYLKAVCFTLISMGPLYLENTLKWLKTAFIDAPYRFVLDVELEYMRLERIENLSPYEDDENDKKDA